MKMNQSEKNFVIFSLTRFFKKLSRVIVDLKLGQQKYNTTSPFQNILASTFYMKQKHQFQNKSRRDE